mmetsp:Transcript_4925/g.6528  ORF Transcript_4925/g.6528 Transcript_4925/m.6528 type:complete len:191 (-) Transcript_4925:629-1201(-)
MGSGTSRMIRTFLARNHRRLLLLGLDGAGKTTILESIVQSSENAQSELKQAITKPTVEFDIKVANFKTWQLYITDVGGQESLRPFWRHHFTGLQGIIFVVDSSDKARLVNALKEMSNVLQDHQLRDIPVLVFANKQDLEGVLTVEEMSEKLQLPEKTKQKHLLKFFSCSGKTGKGIVEGLDWLCTHTENI